MVKNLDVIEKEVTSNLLNHITHLCPIYPHFEVNDPNQTTLTFKVEQNNTLVVAGQRLMKKKNKINYFVHNNIILYDKLI